MYLVFTNPYYSADGYQGDRVTLIWEGMILATAYAYPDTSRYTIDYPVTPESLLYQSWQLALSEASGYPVSIIASLNQQDDWE